MTDLERDIAERWQGVIVLDADVTLKLHHKVWLNAHPHRTPAWFRERVKEGFDVHHLDGDSENNDPANLVLIEHTDHMRIHGCQTLGRLSPRRKKANAVAAKVGKETEDREMHRLFLKRLRLTRKIDALAERIMAKPMQEAT